LVRQASKLSIFHLSYLADTSNKKLKLVAWVSVFGLRSSVFSFLVVLPANCVAKCALRCCWGDKFHKVNSNTL